MVAVDPADAAPKQATAATSPSTDGLGPRPGSTTRPIGTGPSGAGSPARRRPRSSGTGSRSGTSTPTPSSPARRPTPSTPGCGGRRSLNNVAGLFEVAPGFHQVRGLDLSNLTVIEGAEGRIVIDPLTSADTARAALDLVEAHLGARRVTAVIYTHSHVDHFAGIHGVVDEADVDAGRVRVIAPAGFLHAAISENVVAGTAMTRRASYMYGALLPRGPLGHVDAGLGKGVPLFGRQGLVAPTEDVETTGTELVVDGVRIVFQVTPDTEAPAEMNFHFPDHRVLCMAENCTCTLHNLYTPRGAQVRDALAWSKYLNEAIDLFGADSDVLFASHHWPRWGRDDLLDHLATQRDLYRYLHDQTMRLANKGRTMVEAAEELELPPALADAPASRGYYGTVNHNVKAVYQRYLGWFDGNPAHLHPLPPAEVGARYVAAMGGADAVVARAREAFDAGDYRWVAELLDRVVASDPSHRAATALLADTLEQLGYQAESAPWRDFYLTGAQELRSGPPGAHRAGRGRARRDGGDDRRDAARLPRGPPRRPRRLPPGLARRRGRHRSRRGLGRRCGARRPARLAGADPRPRCRRAASRPPTSAWPRWPTARRRSTTSRPTARSPSPVTAPPSSSCSPASTSSR